MAQRSERELEALDADIALEQAPFVLEESPRCWNEASALPKARVAAKKPVAENAPLRRRDALALARPQQVCLPSLICRTPDEATRAPKL